MGRRLTIATCRRLARVAVLGVALVLPSATGGASAGTSDGITPCGVFHATGWSVPGEHGTDWAVLGIRTNTVCVGAQIWANSVTPDLVAVSNSVGASFARKTIGGTAYACALVKVILIAICLEGDGGPHSTGTVVVGNPSENPYASAIVGLSPSVLAVVLGHAGNGSTQQWGFLSDNLDARDVGDPICMRITRIPWTVRGFGPTSVIDRGENWDVLAPGDTCGLAGLHDAANRAAAKLYQVNAREPQDAVLFDVEDWHCLAVRHTSGALILGVPVAACVRRTYPFGNDGPGILSRFVVVPDVSNTQASPVPADLIQALRTRGIATVVQYARLQVTDFLSQPVWWCGVKDVQGAQWQITNGSNTLKGTTWLMGTSGGFPCTLAATEYAPALAHLAITDQSGLLTSDESVWRCRSSVTAHAAMCTFDASADRRIRGALGHASGVGHDPPEFRVGIVATNPSTGRATLEHMLETGTMPGH